MSRELVGGHRQGNSGKLLWPFVNWLLGDVVARVLTSTTPSDMPRLCSDYDANSTVSSNMLTNL